MPREEAEDPFAARWAAEPLDAEVSELLQLGADQRLEQWQLARAQPTARGLSIHWRRDADEVVVLVALDPEGTVPKYRELPGLALSYMDGLGGPGTSPERLEQLFDALTARIDPKRDEWLALLA